MSLFIIIIPGLWLFYEICGVIVYGKYIITNQQRWVEYLEGIKLNAQDIRIINHYGSWNNTPYISRRSMLPLLSSYYIENVGSVLRGSKLHKAIQTKFKELNLAI